MTQNLEKNNWQTTLPLRIKLIKERSDFIDISEQNIIG